MANMDFKLGYQLYSAREEAEKDLRATLHSVKEMGYDGVEFAGFYGHGAGEVAQLLRQTGLQAVSSHVPLDTLETDLEKTTDDHRRIGCRYIAIPHLPPERAPGGEAFAATIRSIARIGAYLKREGIGLLYHNHDFEFTEVSRQYGLDFLYDAVADDMLASELDTCWIRVAGEDPAAYIRKYAGRCPVVHLKDYVGTKGEQAVYALIDRSGKDDQAVAASDTFDFRPVGYGVQDIPAILRAGTESGTRWFVVEQDRSSDRPALAAARMSAGYVLALRTGNKA